MTLTETATEWPVIEWTRGHDVGVSTVGRGSQYIQMVRSQNI